MPQVAVIQQRTAGLQKIRPPLPGSYAALGASETFGIGANPYTNGYAYHVAHALGARHFVDLGIPGATLHQAYDTEIAGALSSRASLATLFFGFNDIIQGVTIDSFTSDLHDLVLTLQRAHARVLVIALPDLSQLPAVKHSVPGARQIIDRWNGAMQRVARQAHAAFLDLAISRYSLELAHHPDYISQDGLHPSNRGHARLAQVVVQTIIQDHLWNQR
jgi:lysophospholipase L1-like esterase